MRLGLSSWLRLGTGAFPFVIKSWLSKEGVMMEPKVTFQAHCNICNKTVSVLFRLNRDDLISVLKNGGDVRVMHVVPEGDHIWSLSTKDKQNLSNAVAKGLV
jgi:hypothetical protein